MTIDIFLSAIEEHDKFVFGESMHRKHENNVKSVSLFTLSLILELYHPIT